MSSSQLGRAFARSGVFESEHYEQEWRDREMVFRGLIELARDAMFVADERRCLIEVNAAACKLLDYSREELLGKTIADLLAPEDVPRIVHDSFEIRLGEWK